MAQMQSQFFEHSQNQMQFMAEMLAHIGRTQQASVRQDMARIEEITRELQELKSQLASLPAPAPARPPQRKTTATRKKNSTGQKAGDPAAEPASLPPPEVTAAAAPPPAQRRAQSAAPADGARARDKPLPVIPTANRLPRDDDDAAEDDTAFVASDMAEAGDLPDDQASAPPAVTDAHARLTDRMARLAQERNAGWRRILNAFRRKPPG